MSQRTSRRLLLVALNANVFLALAGLWGALFGPPGHVLLGVPALLFPAVVVASLGKAVTVRGVKLDPDSKTFVGAMAGVGAIACGLGLIVMFATLRGDGSPDTTDGRGAFTSRPRYVLNDHGTRTEVSRLRFVVGDASFFLCWFGGVLFANGAAYGMVAAALRADAQSPHWD